MTFRVEDFTDLLDEIGVEHRLSGKSLAVKECPACGRGKYKVLFNMSVYEEGEPLIGRCMSGSCGEVFSSIRYLLAQGVSKSKVEAIHGNNTEENLKSMFSFENVDYNSKDIDIINEAEAINISQFTPLSFMPDHQISKYATKRGYVELFSNKIMMNLNTLAVSFIIHNKDNNPIGYQERFIMKGAMPKCKTSTGFKRDFVMAFPNDGDIVVCEGPFTALSAWHFGFYGVCTFGANFTKKQLEGIIEIAKKYNKKVLYAMDNDEAGISSFGKFRAMMIFRGYGDIPVIVPEVGKDLNDSWMTGKRWRKENRPWVNPSLPEIELF